MILTFQIIVLFSEFVLILWSWPLQHSFRQALCDDIQVVFCLVLFIIMSPCFISIFILMGTRITRFFLNSSNRKSGYQENHISYVLKFQTFKRYCLKHLVYPYVNCLFLKVKKKQMIHHNNYQDFLHIYRQKSPHIPGFHRHDCN